MIEEGGGNMAGVPVTDRGTWMQLGEGRVFYPLDPKPEDVNIDDIATALSRIVRYNGHSDIWIVVAQHCCNGVALAKQDDLPDYMLYAILMHEAAEAYVGDLIRPLKCLPVLAPFKDIENNIYSAIEEALEIPKIAPSIIKHYDNLALAWEKRDFFKSSRPWPYMPDLGDHTPQLVQWSHNLARSRFLEEYYKLSCSVLNTKTREEEEYYKLSCSTKTREDEFYDEIDDWNRSDV